MDEAEIAQTPAARAAAKIMARRVPAGQSGEDVGLRETAYPVKKGQGGFPKSKKKETEEELQARLEKAANKFEKNKIMARLYARRHYEKKKGTRNMPERAQNPPLQEQKSPRKREVLVEAIVALEAERDELTKVIDMLRKYSD